MKKKADAEPAGPSVGGLTAVLKAAPDPEEWTYEGTDKYGHVIRWRGQSDHLEEGVERTVRFHVHGRSEAGWEFGGAWIEDTPVNLNINESLKFDVSMKALTGVANHFAAKMKLKPVEEDKSKEGSWRKVKK